MKVKVFTKPLTSDCVWYVVIDAQKYDKSQHNNTYNISCTIVDIEHNSEINIDMPLSSNYGGVNGRYYPRDIIEADCDVLVEWSLENFRWQGWYKKMK